MNLIDVVLLHTTFIIFPILVYYFFIIYLKNINGNEINLILEICLTFSVYLILRYSDIFNFDYPCMFVSITLIISYLNNKLPYSILLSLFLITYSYTEIVSLPILIIEYLIYFLLYIFINKKYNKKLLFINMMITTKIIIKFLILKNVLLNKDLIMFIIISIVYLIVTHLALILLKQAERNINLHMTIKELEKEKQIRNSLFKITHEIKNPLAICKGYIDMFDPKNKEHALKYIPIIKEEINHTLIILQDFLSLNKTKIEKEILDINLLLEDIVSSFEIVLKNQNVTLKYEEDEDEIFVLGDYFRLKQVIVNIIKNSMEALENKENKTIKIDKEIKMNNIIIHFEDNGCGIDNEGLSKIKNAFFTTKKEGTGLGIYLSDEIIKAHNGNLIYESIKGEGTIVKIILPITDIEK